MAKLHDILNDLKAQVGAISAQRSAAPTVVTDNREQPVRNTDGATKKQSNPTPEQEGNGGGQLPPTTMHGAGDPDPDDGDDDDDDGQDPKGGPHPQINYLRPVASCSSSPPLVPGAYHVNSRSGCFRPGSFGLGATFFRPDAPGAPWRSLPSNHTPSANPLPHAAPEAPVRLPPSAEAFRPRILCSQMHPVPSHDTPLPLNISQTLPYPPLPPLSSGHCPTTLPILPVRRTPVAYSPASTGCSPTPLSFALYPPHSSRPLNVILSAGCYTDRLTSFPTLGAIACQTS